MEEEEAHEIKSNECSCYLDLLHFVDSNFHTLSVADKNPEVTVHNWN